MLTPRQIRDSGAPSRVPDEVREARGLSLAGMADDLARSHERDQVL
jgi:hypothetical protein